METYFSQEEIRKEIINDLVKKRSTIVPIIGDDTIVYQEYEGGAEIPFQEFIVKQFQSKYPHVEVSDTDLHAMKERGYYGLSLLSQYYPGRFLDNFMNFVSNNADKIKLKREVHDFLVAFNFPVIITTLCFDIIERQLKQEIRDYRPIWYQLNEKNDTLPPRCVYHIFGQARDGVKWVYDEDLLLTFLLSHNSNDCDAKGLIDYLNENKNEKKLFVLGCNQPNWLFRFLWQPTQSGRTDNLKTIQGYWIHKDKPEDSFDNFLRQKNFSSDEQVKDILAEATELLRKELESEAQERNRSNSKDEHFDVFISYASEDRDIATAIFEALRKMNVKAWFDDRGKGEIKPGEKYWEMIEYGIKHSAHYMPIITGNWIHKHVNSSSLKEETFKVRDWVNECQKTGSSVQLKSTYSIPVIVKGAVYNDEPITEGYVEGATQWFLPKVLFKGIDMANYDGKEISSLNKIDW